MNEWEKRIAALEKENAELKRQLEGRQNSNIDIFNKTFHSTFGDKMLFSRIVLRKSPKGFKKSRELSKEDIETYFMMLSKAVLRLLTESPAEKKTC